MKKVYLGLLATSFFSVSNAQVVKNVMPVQKHSILSVDGYRPSSNAITNYSQRNTVIWSDDFSDTSTWTMTNTSAPISEDWVITSNQDDLPQGQSIVDGGLLPFMSETAANGFALINSDGQPGNEDGNGAIVAEMTTATPIDLSSDTAVALTFMHSYRWWQEARGVRVSGDNGATWTEFEITTSAYPDNQNSENPTIEKINISSVAGGQSEVLIQFYYNDNDFWGWYWVVDDVKIEKLPDNDIIIRNAWTSDIITDYEYSIVPQSQVTPMRVGTIVENVGAQPQTFDVVADISNGSSSLYNQSQTVSDLQPQAVDTLWWDTNLTLSDIGEYTVSFTLPEDADSTGNTTSKIIETSEFIFAHNRTDDESRGFDINESNSIGTRYLSKAEDMVYGIDVKFGPTTTENILINANIRVAQNNQYVLLNQIAHTVTAADIASENGITLTFESPTMIEANKVYLVDIEKLEESEDRLFIQTSNDYSDDQATLCYGPFGSSGVAWYRGWEFAPHVRMNFDVSLGLDEQQSVVGMNVFPNPASDNANVSFELNNPADVTIAVTDISGKVVFTRDLGTTATGSNNVELKTGHLSNGIYFVNINANGSVTTEKLVVRK